MPIRSLIGLALATGWLAGCSVAPVAPAAGRPGHVTVVAGEFPVLHDGISAAEVRAALGEPAEINAAPSAAGTSEVWIYHLEKYIGKTQVVTHLESRGAAGVLAGEPLAGILEPVYTMVDEKIEVTLHLLFNNGQLVYQAARSRKILGG